MLIYLLSPIGAHWRGMDERSARRETRVGSVPSERTDDLKVSWPVRLEEFGEIWRNMWDSEQCFPVFSSCVSCQPNGPYRNIKYVSPKTFVCYTYKGVTYHQIHIPEVGILTALLRHTNNRFYFARTMEAFAWEEKTREIDLFWPLCSCDFSWLPASANSHTSLWVLPDMLISSPHKHWPHLSLCQPIASTVRLNLN